MSVVREVNVAGRVLKFEFEKFAKQSNGSVMVSSGGTQVLVTVCSEREASPAVDFFPSQLNTSKKHMPQEDSLVAITKEKADQVILLP